MSRCPNNVRHWFTVYRMVGVRAPKCQRCGAPNPRPLDDWEVHEYEAWKRPTPQSGATLGGGDG